MTTSRNGKYLPVLGDEAFAEVPSTSYKRPPAGSPGDRYVPDDPMLVTKQLVPASEIVRELAWRIMVALQQHGTWAAIRTEALEDAIVAESRRDAADKERVRGSVLTGSFKEAGCFPPEVVKQKVHRALGLLMNIGLGYNEDYTLVWPTDLLTRDFC